MSGKSSELMMDLLKEMALLKQLDEGGTITSGNLTFTVKPDVMMATTLHRSRFGRRPHHVAHAPSASSACSFSVTNSRLVTISRLDPPPR